MPLTERERGLLFEIYGVTPLTEVYAAPGQPGMSILPASFSVTQPIVLAINRAFDTINESEAAVDRVITILDEYESISLDPSRIERDGYTFIHSRSVAQLRAVLMPYTGIIMSDLSRSNSTPIG